MGGANLLEIRDKTMIDEKNITKLEQEQNEFQKEVLKQLREVIFKLEKWKNESLSSQIFY